jgi:hypothetical protein
MRLIHALGVASLSVGVACRSAGPFPTGGSTGPGVEHRAVEAAVTDSFFRAIERFDYPALRRAVTPDFELVEDTLRLGIDQFVEIVRSFEGKATIRYRFDAFNTRAAASTAWTTYRNRGTMTAQGQQTEFEWLETAVVLQRGGTWRLDRLQSTPVRRRE